MSRRIVSWKVNESRVSPAVSSASGVSVVSINSIASDMKTVGATGVQPAELGAKLTNWHGSANSTTDESFVQHDVYFFKDGNITFLVDGTLYCVHRYFFSRDSVYFSTKFSQLDVRDHEHLNTIISLGDVERKDFEAFLSALYPKNFEEHGLSYEQWKSVLHLSTRWSFASLRKLALKSIYPPTPFDRLLLARTYSVDHWVLPALSALCERTKPISLKEACQMNIEDVVLVATVREEIRNQRPFVDTAEIKRRIGATQVRMVTHVADDDDDPFSSESEADEREPMHPSAKTGTSTGAKEGGYNGIKEVAVAAATASNVADNRGDEHPTGPARDSSAEWAVSLKKKKTSTSKKKSSRVVCKTEENLGVTAKPEIIPDKVEKAIPPDPVLAKAEYPIPEKDDRKGLLGQDRPRTPTRPSWLNTLHSSGVVVSVGSPSSTTSTRQ